MCTYVGRASIGITLLGMVHPIWEKHFRCETCVDGRLSSRAARVKKVNLCLYNYFCKFFGVNYF